jgi:hypothetical protein
LTGSNNLHTAEPLRKLNYARLHKELNIHRELNTLLKHCANKLRPATQTVEHNAVRHRINIYSLEQSDASPVHEQRVLYFRWNKANTQLRSLSMSLWF